MTFQTPITIKAALEAIQKNEYVLPAIQREFTWKASQICGLFDSLMQGYPIGSLLFWKVEASKSRDYTWYGFLRDFHRKTGRHCPVLDIPDQPLTAILDGQQRLTSLNIALRGSHTEKEPRKWWDNPTAFPVKHLYLNLAQLAEENDQGYVYDFRFLTPQRASEQDDDHRWFRVSDVYDFQSGYEVLKALQSIQLGNSELAGRMLHDLYMVVHEKKLLPYFEESEQNLDKVLNIFIRVNSAGTPLAYSDLLLSIATAQWKDLDARQAILQLVDDLNGLGPGFQFSKDLVLKSGLVLSDIQSVEFKVTNFNSANMRILEKKWEGIARTIHMAVSLLADFGFSGQTITADSVVIPIAYYLHHHDHGPSFLDSVTYEDERERIRMWVCQALVKAGLWGAGLDSLLVQLREALKNEEGTSFPVDALDRAFAKRGRPITFTQDELEDLLDREYGDKRTFPLLSLLYSFVDLKHRFDVDHIFPKSAFTRVRLSKAGVSDEEIPAALERFNRLANLQLLEGGRNKSKQDKAPAEWLKKQFPVEADRGLYRSRHDLGDVPDTMQGFVAFYEARRTRLLERMGEVFRVVEDVRVEPSRIAEDDRVHRTTDEIRVAYFLSRCGIEDPPKQLETERWSEAYEVFRASLGAGRDAETFRNTLKAARDTFDAFVENSRAGFHQQKELPLAFSSVLNKWKGRSDEELWSEIRSLATSEVDRPSSLEGSDATSQRPAD